jgi:hypothetical protein
MLQRALELRDEVREPELKPFDEAILAVVLVRAGTIDSGWRRLFCTLDYDLSPFDRKSNVRPQLKAAYDAIGLEVRTAFDLS